MNRFVKNQKCRAFDERLPQKKLRKWF